MNDNWEETLKNDLIDRARKNLREQGRMGGSAPTQLSNAFLRNSGDILFLFSFFKKKRKTTFF